MPTRGRGAIAGAGATAGTAGSFEPDATPTGRSGPWGPLVSWWLPSAGTPPGARTLDDLPPTPNPGADSPASGQPAEGSPQSGKPDAAPGLRAQAGAAKEAALRLLHAHVELARVEFEEILGKVKRVAALVGAAVALLLFVGLFVFVGTSLFIGEWLFGSIGWGVLLVTELAVTVALTCVLLAIDIPSRRLQGAFFAGLVVGVVVAVLAGTQAFNQLWESIGKSAAPDLTVATRPLFVGIAAGAIVGAVLGLLAGIRRGIGVAVGLAFAGAVLFLFVGAFSAITFSWHVGVAVGIAVGILDWAGLSAWWAFRTGIDFERWSHQFYPSQTIETTKETIEWVRARTPLGPKS